MFKDYSLPIRYEGEHEGLFLLFPLSVTESQGRSQGLGPLDYGRGGGEAFAGELATQTRYDLETGVLG